MHLLSVMKLDDLVTKSTLLLSVCSFTEFFSTSSIWFGDRYLCAGTDSWKYKIGSENIQKLESCLLHNIVS